MSTYPSKYNMIIEMHINQKATTAIQIAPGKTSLEPILKLNWSDRSDEKMYEQSLELHRLNSILCIYFGISRVHLTETKPT